MHPESSQIRRATVCARAANEVELELSRQNLSCTACEEGRGCGAGLLRFSQTSTKLTILAEDWPELSVGDSVDLQLSSRALLRLSLLGYGIPLLFFIAAVVLTSPWLSEFWVSVNALLALAIGAKVGDLLANRNRSGLAPLPATAADSP